MNHEQTVLRELTKQYLELIQTSENDERRSAWKRLHDLDSIRPMVHIRGGRIWQEILDTYNLECTTPILREAEGKLRLMIFRSKLGDDTVFEPWYTFRAIFKCRGWGLECERKTSGEKQGAWKGIHPLKDLDDLSSLRFPRHIIDEQATTEKYEILQNMIGDLIDIDVDRSPNYRAFAGDIATDLGHLRGIEQMMIDMYDAPEQLHRLLSFMRDGILKTHEEAEEAGDWGLTSHENQSMPYGGGLLDPAPNQRGVKRNQLWGYMAAQELTLVSPEMHDEFMLRYQLPIIDKFGLAAYGCCEDLTNKIDMLRKIPNLRRIAVAPLAKIESCAEQIGRDYVISYRPNPADMVCVGFDEKQIRRIIAHALDVFQGCHIEINLKDVETCQHQPERLKGWVKIVREEINAT